MIGRLELKPGTALYKLVAFFVNHINWCEGYYYDTETPKPENKLYLWIYRHWLWPWEQNDCLCCNTVRGMLYMAIIFILWGVL